MCLRISSLTCIDSQSPTASPCLCTCLHSPVGHVHKLYKLSYIACIKAVSGQEFSVQKCCCWGYCPYTHAAQKLSWNLLNCETNVPTACLITSLSCCRRPNSIPISCYQNLNLDGLLVKMWEMMALVCTMIVHMLCIPLCSILHCARKLSACISTCHVWLPLSVKDDIQSP